MKKYLVSLIALIIAISGFAKTETITTDSYNMRRGTEEAEKGNFETALEYYDKELDGNPQNTFAHFMIASIHCGSPLFSSML